MRMKLPNELLIPVFWAIFSTLSLAGVDAQYAPSALAALLGLHLLLALCLYLTLVVGRHLGEVAGLTASVGAGLVLVWHARELTYRPASLVLTVLAALVLALPIHLLMHRGELRPTVGRACLALGCTGALVVGLVAAAFQYSTVLRWHLLRHNKMLGTPAYYLLADSIAELETELFDRFRPSPEPGKETADDDISGSERNLVSENNLVSEKNVAMGRQPHLVFILLDTLRADALALGGGSEDLMPRLNAYLKGAYRFNDVMANASWTRPSMASMWTGLLPEEHGARDVNDPLEETQITLAEVLGQQGYRTAAFVSNVGAVGKTAGFAQGFEVFYEFPDQPYARAGRIRQTVEQWLDGPWLEGQQDVTENGESQPLFLYLHFLDPHDPYLAGDAPTSKSRAEYEAAYRQELLYLDEELSRVLELLESRLPGPRAVLLTSDHGEEFGEHEEYGHGYSLYRELIHIPLAFHTGDGQGDLPQPLEGRDVFDLISTWSNSVSTSGPTSGRFDVPAWARARARSQRYSSIYYSSEGRLLLRPYLSKVCMRTVESEGFKLIWSAYGDTTELYDSVADPDERRNLVAEQPEVSARLRALIDPSVRFWNFPEPYERSAEESRQLRALGYIDN